MMNWLRRVDPAFYHKEPFVLRTHAQIPRYGEDAQVALRMDVLREDWTLRIATVIIALCAYALVAMPAIWTRVDAALLAVAVLVAVLLYRVRGRLRATLAAVAIGFLFAVHAHPLTVAPLAGMIAAGLSLVGSNVIGREWRVRPQAVTWAAFAALVIICAYAMAFNATIVALHQRVAIGAIAVAYLGVCFVAGRIHRAELEARPEGVLSLPQSIVPLLERSHDHAVICWLV